jgi:mannosylglycerate hydrolase
MKTLHVISHTHWDREWYLTFQQFRLKLLHLVDNLLELIEKDKNFKYFMLDGQTIVLDDYLLMRPKQESVLREHIRKGRILIGPWHILPDMFLVGPEAHIRNLLQGDHTAKRFGPKMMVGYMPDSFGHIGQMPQILRGFGIDNACLWRGLDDQPTEFWWTSPDGSRVLMAYLRNSYANGAGLPTSEPEKFAEDIATAGEVLADHSAADDYLIMLGNDHMEPPVNTSSAITYADRQLKDTKVIHSTLPNYIKAIQATVKKTDLPTVEGELRSSKRAHLLPGVLSTRMWIKQRNHASEVLLEKWAEPFSTFAERISDNNSQNLTNSPIIHHPAPILRQAWRLLMENHPHDSICGCSIDQVHEEMRPRFDQVDQIGEEITGQSLERLASFINTGAGQEVVGAVVVFNPSSFPRTDHVMVEMVLPQEVTGFELLDETGQVIPHGTLGLGSQELINMSFDRHGFLEAFGMVHEGRIAGMGLQNIRIERQGESVELDVIMSQVEPNLTAWNTGMAQMGPLLDDKSITTFNVRAHTVETTRALFTAREVPGLGYRTYYLRARDGQRRPPTKLSPLARVFMPLVGRLTQTSLGKRLVERFSNEPECKPPYRIENEFFSVEPLPEGTLSVLDKRGGQTYRGLNRFMDSGDCGDEYNYSPSPADTQPVGRLKKVCMRRSPARQTLELALEMRVPLSLKEDRKARSRESVTVQIISNVTIYPGVPRIDIHTRVDNRAKDHRLRVHFPAPFGVESADYDGHFEVTRRPLGLPEYDETWREEPRPEVPQCAFTDISDGTQGLMIANRGLSEVEVLKTRTGSEIALTLLRSVGWLSRDDFSTRQGHAGPFMATPGAQMIGTWDFDYAIIPHSGNWEKAFTQAYGFETPLRAFGTSVHTSTLPASSSLLLVGPGSFVVSAIKETEDGRGWLVRGYNITSDHIQVTVKPWKRFKRVERVNLSEEKLAAIQTASDGSVTFPAHGHEIVTVVFSE